MRHKVFGIWLAWVAVIFAGCATPPPPKGPTRPAGLFPTEALITHRVMLTALGRQFTMNGYLAQSAAGRRLIVTETFGQALADVLVKRDGTVFVMRSSRMLRADWIRRYLAADVEAIFNDDASAKGPVTMPDPNHFVIKRRWYKLDLRVLEIRPGPQKAELFDETGAEKP